MTSPLLTAKRGTAPTNILRIVREAAEKAGVAASTIMRAEQGREMRSAQLIAILAAYGFEGLAEQLARLVALP